MSRVLVSNSSTHQEDISPNMGSGSQGFSVGSTSHGVGSFGSTSSGSTVGVLGFLDPKETNRWDILTTVQGNNSTDINSRISNVGIEPAQHINSTMQQLSWLSSMTSQDNVFQLEQSGIELNDPNEIIPLWRRHQVTLSTINPVVLTNSIGSTSNIPNDTKDWIQLPTETIRCLYYSKFNTESLYSKQNRIYSEVKNNYKAVANAVKSDGMYSQDLLSQDLNISRELFRQKQMEYKTMKWNQRKDANTADDTLFHMEEMEEESDWVSFHTTPSPAIAPHVVGNIGK